MSNNILRFKKDGKYVPVDVNAENVLLKNQSGEYTGENLENLLGEYHNLEQNYTPRLNMLEASDQTITAQLADKASQVETINRLNGKRDKGVPINLNDVSSDILLAIQNKESETEFNLLSIPRPYSVTPDTTTFVEVSTNLFNVYDVVYGYRISSSGTFSESASYVYTNPIKVYDVEYLTTKGVSEIAFYDVNDNFISRLGATVIAENTFTLPLNAYVARANLDTNSSHWKANAIQINRGSTLLPFEPFWQRLSDVRVDGESVEMTKGMVQAKNTTFIEPQTNLFNKNYIVTHKRINPSGIVVEAINYGYSEPILVKGMTHLTANGIYDIAFYDMNDVFVSRDQVKSGSSSTGYTFTVPFNAYFARAVFPMTSDFWYSNTIQINEGTSILPYEEHRATFTKNSGLEKINRIIKEDLLDRDDSYMFDVPIDGVFKTDKYFGDWSNFKNSKHIEVYAMFDNLMGAHPDYITSEVIGKDFLDNDIKMYRITPQQPPSDKPTKRPKIFLTCGTHGHEKSSTISSYFMFKEMLENWKSDTLLEGLRFNVDWLFVPIVNPSGWDLHQRKNANGVDLNRNFPYQWTGGKVGSVTYPGPNALSEPESRAVHEVFMTELDIDIMCDFHNFGHETLAENQNRFLWILTEDIPYVQHMAQNLISRLSRKWEDEYEWFPEGSLTGYTGRKNGGAGLMQSYASSLSNVKFSSTLEICSSWNIDPESVGNDANVVKAGVESVTNWFLIQLKELIK